MWHWTVWLTAMTHRDALLPDQCDHRDIRYHGGDDHPDVSVKTLDPKPDETTAQSRSPLVAINGKMFKFNAEPVTRDHCTLGQRSH